MLCYSRWISRISQERQSDEAGLTGYTRVWLINQILAKGVAAPRPIESLIHVIRGQKVMVDADLATLYEVPTGTLNQAVGRNLERFPKDFAFRLSKEEFDDWKSQSLISNPSAKMGLRIDGRSGGYSPAISTGVSAQTH